MAHERKEHREKERSYGPPGRYVHFAIFTIFIFNSQYYVLYCVSILSFLNLSHIVQYTAEKHSSVLLTQAFFDITLCDCVSRRSHTATISCNLILERRIIDAVQQLQRTTKIISVPLADCTLVMPDTKLPGQNVNDDILNVTK